MLAYFQAFPSLRDTLLLMPELQITLFACFALVLDVILPKEKKRLAARVSLLGVAFSAASIALLVYQYSDSLPQKAFYDMYVLDGFSLFFKALFLLAVALSIGVTIKYLDLEKEQTSEYYSLMLFSIAGMMFLTSSHDLISIYVSLELITLPVYVLVGYFKRIPKSNEASMKYFLLGAFSSGILLYGFSLLYALTGQTNIEAIAQIVPEIIKTGSATYLLLLAIILIAAGVLFKMAAVPFHSWAPDAYEGAPTSTTAFMSVAVKSASYVLLARLFFEALPSAGSVGSVPGWTQLLGVIAAVTMTIGNIAAATQTNLKRLLAYSSISHAGYLLLGAVAGNEVGYTGIAVYLVAYTVMNLGTFGVIISITRHDEGDAASSERNTGEHIKDLNGLVKKSPAIALMMLVFLLSLAGIPPTAGFMGKYLLFAGLIKNGTDWMTKLAVLGVINTVISFYYYSRLIRVMFIADLTEERPLTVGKSLQTVLLISALLTILIGIYPQPVIKISESAIKQFGNISDKASGVVPKLNND
ncbi:MAG: NADH-quinone oxidoreductase subunit N [Blastocatellia bacterium]|nr:NADH-quinone oxidoreductase subunit N [Blastocatellia bacterium]